MINERRGVSIDMAKTEQRDPRHMIRIQHSRDHRTLKSGDRILGVCHIYQN